MRSNFGLLGPVADGLGGLARIDDQRGAGYRHPVTEAGADVNNYVCEFTGGASANETGVGLGLAGADLVLTQVGGVPGAVGGQRLLTHGVHYFSMPVALVDGCLLNVGGKWAVLMQIADWSTVTEEFIFFCLSTAPGNHLDIYQDWNGYIGPGRPGVTTYTGGSPYVNGATATAHPLSGALWVAMWDDGVNGIRLGWTAGAQPTSWADFPERQRMNTGVSTNGWPSFDYLRYIGGNLKIRSITLSKIALGG